VPYLQSEQILVVPTELFHRLGYFQGFTAQVDRYLDKLLDPANTSFRPRGEMEQDASYKQLIPYCIFRYRDEDGCESIFQYTRGTGQGEGRLHRKQSVGIGGHISLDDTAAFGADPYNEGLRRELDEEVFIETRFRGRCVGLINDDQTEVGRVHLGVVHLFDVDEPQVTPRESELIESGFRPVERLLADMSRFETWSAICLESLFAKASETRH
jgi:predicted NUDIX family phosphoesterase